MALNITWKIEIKMLSKKKEIILFFKWLKRKECHSFLNEGNIQYDKCSVRFAVFSSQTGQIISVGFGFSYSQTVAHNFGSVLRRYQNPSFIKYDNGDSVRFFVFSNWAYDFGSVLRRNQNRVLRYDNYVFGSVFLFSN